MMQLLWRAVWRFLKNLKIELPHDPAIPHPKELTAGSQRDLCTPMFTAALFPIVKSQKQPKCPSTDERNNKMWCIQTTKYYSGRKF